MADNQQAPTSEQDEGAAFSEAFAERAADPFGKKDEEGQAGSEQEPANNDQSAAEADPVEAPAPAAASDTSGFDPWNNLTPEQQSYFKRLEASERSNRGRVGALTKKLNTVTAPAPAAPKQEGEQNRSDDGTGSEAEDIEAKLDRVAADYGDVNGPVVEVVKELRREIASLKASATRDEVDADAEALTEAYGELAEKHPDFADYNPENEQFVSWVVDQPANIQALINSYDPKEVSLALTLFKTEQGIAGQAAGQGGSGEGNSGTATGDRRQRQLEGSRQVSSRGAPVAAGVPNDFRAAFKARSQQIEKESGRA